MNSSSTDFETVQSYLAFFFVDCENIINSIDDIRIRYANVNDELKCTNEKDVKKIIKSLISENDLKTLKRMCRFSDRIIYYKKIQKQNIFNEDDKYILQAIENKKYKIYNEYGCNKFTDDKLYYMNIVFDYERYVEIIKEFIKNTKYEMKYV